MKKTDRRSFIRNSSLTMAGIFLSRPLSLNAGPAPHFSFSTLGCPKWSFREIVDFAAEYGYNGIEIRGLQGELNLIQSPEFSSGERISSARKLAEDKQLKIICLGSSAQLHHADAAKRKSNLDEAKRYIDLAGKLDCPFVRVFPDTIPEGQDYDTTIGLITAGMKDLAEYAKGSGVSVLLESHGDITGTEVLLRIMRGSESPNSGMVWDICNMWSATRESPADVYGKLQKYIRHTHFRDIKYEGNKYRSVLFGMGEAPVEEAVKVLQKGNYDGYYSFEWEKLWEPGIEDPEIAFPQFITAIKKYFI